MLVKSLFTLFFLGTNCYVFLILYLRSRFRIVPIISIIGSTILLWVENNRYLFYSKEDFLMLVVFSYVQVIAWYFLRFIFSRSFNVNYGEIAQSSSALRTNFERAKKIAFSIVIPIVISINQLSIIWGLDLK
jgi:hypothetical protein